MQHLYTCKGSAMRVSIYFYTKAFDKYPMKGSS